MKSCSQRIFWLGGFGVALFLTALSPILLFGQFPFGTPTTPDAQRNALGAVRSQVNWLQNATRTAPNNISGGYGNVQQQFQALRAAYTGLTHTLNPQQSAQGANDLAELDAGLGIIQEAFTNYQEAVAAGQAPNSALRDLCQILREASQVWLQELNQRCAKLRVGW
jgi:hypothetical protein